MLGLSSAINTNRGYAPAERFRQRLRSAGTSLGTVTDITGFTLVQTSGTNGAQVIQSGDLRLTGTGHTSIQATVSPGTRYTCIVRAVGYQSGNRGQINIGNSVNDTTYHGSGNLTSESTQTAHFIPTQSTIYITVSSVGDNKWARYDNFSLKRKA